MINEQDQSLYNARLWSCSYRREYEVDRYVKILHLPNITKLQRIT